MNVDIIEIIFLCLMVFEVTVAWIVSFRCFRKLKELEKSINKIEEKVCEHSKRLSGIEGWKAAKDFINESKESWKHIDYIDAEEYLQNKLKNREK